VGNEAAGIKLDCVHALYVGDEEGAHRMYPQSSKPERGLAEYFVVGKQRGKRWYENQPTVS